MLQRALLKDGDVEPLGAAVCEVLEDIGVVCQSEEILTALGEAGATIAPGGQVATFPKRMTQAFAEQLRAEGRASAAREPGFSAPALPAVGTQVAPFFYDYRTRERRSSNRADFITSVKLGDMLGAAGHALSMTDVPPMMEPLGPG